MKADILDAIGYIKVVATEAELLTENYTEVLGRAQIWQRVPAKGVEN